MHRSFALIGAGLCVVLATLELVHPAWTGGAVAEAVSALWLPLHAALVIGYLVLAGVLWRTAASSLARLSAILFGVCASAFIAVDGLVIGLRASADPIGANALWASPVVTLLADATGATWCAALLARAASDPRTPADRVATVLFALTWLTFVAAIPLGLPLFVSRGAAVAAMAWQMYRGGAAGVPSALLAFAAVLRQHVGPEAALGLLCVATALGLAGRKD